MSQELTGKTVWITGAGTGIGEAIALAMAGAGATVVVSGRRRNLLDDVAKRIITARGKALAMEGDVADRTMAAKIVKAIVATTGRLDILVNNAGMNIAARRWDQQTTEAIDQVLNVNLAGAFHCAAAALVPMREQRDGLLIHTGSWAGRFWSTVPGSAYTAAKSAVAAMSHSINMEEYKNGIRSTVVMPAEINTPIMDQRPIPPAPEIRATMLQPGDLGELYLFIATRPKAVCLNEVVISPTQNRSYA